MSAATSEAGDCTLRCTAVVAALVSLGVGSIATMAQPPESQPTTKRLSPERIESVLRWIDRDRKEN
jgi:hypothetical protein